jgi:mRNA interferase RelE/StbE
VYKVFFTSKSDKELSKLASIDIDKVLLKISQLTSPFETNLDIKKLVNYPDYYRLRIGQIRVIFEVDKLKKEVWIRKIGYRGGVYR